MYHDLAPQEFYSSCQSIDLAARLRMEVSGKVCVITAVFGEEDSSGDGRYICLSEMLAYVQEQDYSYAVCFRGTSYDDLLRGNGFLPLPEMPDCYIVDMRKPTVFIFDTPSFIKSQFSNAARIHATMWESHKKLRLQAASLFPGQLVLYFYSEILNYRLIKLIMQNNPAINAPAGRKKLGKNICVPFGKTLKGILIPECVTKDLHTEKLYDIDMEHFTIKEFPHFAPMEIQIRTIKSFMRPVILVDDLYHKGYRLKAVEESMQKEGIQPARLIVGILSGRGSDLAHIQNEPIESVYFVPNMRSWMIESDLYPFIGGDGIRVKEQIHSSPSLPSVNSILPYQFPSFMKGASMNGFYHLSVQCLENARDIFRVLERLYQDKYGRKLTMARIGEILAEPRHPDTCILDTSVVQEAPSILLEREMQKLHRMKHLLDGDFRF